MERIKVNTTKDDSEPENVEKNDKNKGESDVGEIQASYIDSIKYITEVFKTQRPDDILRLTLEDPCIIIDTDIIDFKLVQLFQLSNIIPVTVSFSNDETENKTNVKISKKVRLGYSKYYYNLGERKIYRSADTDTLDIVGLIFLNIPQKKFIDSRYQRDNFINDTNLSDKKITKLEKLEENISAEDIDFKIFYFTQLREEDMVREIDKIVELSNYLLTTRDLRLRLKKEIKTSEISYLVDLDKKLDKPDQLYRLISLFDYFRLDTRFLFEGYNKNITDEIHRKISTKFDNYAANIKAIYDRDSQNYYRSLCKTAYIKKYGKDKYDKLPKLKTTESTLNPNPIVPDILPLLDKKTAQLIKAEVDVIVQNNLIDASIYFKNRKIINLANLIKVEKFPDQQWQKFKELLLQLGLTQDKIFIKNPNWIEVDGIKILCRHHYVNIISAKKGLTTEEIHKKLSEFIESDSSEFCMVCGEILTYRDKFEGLVSEYEMDGFKSSYDETFKLIQRVANIWVYGYLVNSYKDNDYVNRAISKNIANILYDFLKPVYDKMTNQKNKDPTLVNKKFNIYLNTYVGASIIKIIEDNSKTLGLYGVQNLTQTNLIEKVFEIIKKIIGNDIYIFDDISEVKIEQGIKNAYKMLTDSISKIEYRPREVKFEYDPYKDMLLSLNKDYPIPETVSKITDIVKYIKNNNIMYSHITLPSEDNLSIKYTEQYQRYINLFHEKQVNNISYRHWITSTLLSPITTRHSYEFSPDNKNKNESLNIIYGITNNYHNLKKIKGTKETPREKLHKHSWTLSVWGKKDIRWNGTMSDTSIVFGNGDRSGNLTYIDTLCEICGKSLLHPGDDNMSYALKQQNEKDNFYRYFRFICPKDLSNHKFVNLPNSGVQKCTKCGLELSYISDKNTEYYDKYYSVYEKENTKKSIKLDLKELKNHKASVPIKDVKIESNLSKRITEELVQKMISEKNKQQPFLEKLYKLGNTEGILYNSKDLPDPNRTVRGDTLDYYLLKIIGMIGMAKKGELKDISVTKINDLVGLKIKYEKFTEPIAQYDNIISILGKISKIDNQFALYICNNLFLSDQHNSKLEKNKEAEIESNINFTQADQSFIDNDQEEEISSDNMFSYENMDYDGHNDDV